MIDFRCFIPGIPKPAGSKRAFPIKGGRIVVTDACKTSKDWKATVAATVMATWQGPPLLGPVQFDVTFWMPRPKGHYGTGKNSRQLRASAPAYPATRPDVLKLARAVEDALSCIIYRDDAQIVVENLAKRYSRIDERPGAEIHLKEARGEA